MPEILIFRIGQLGDTLIALPAIEAIRHKYPSHRLILLTDRHKTSKGYISSWDILGPTGWFDQVIYYDARVKGWNKLKNLLFLIKKLRDFNVEHLYNLSPVRTKFSSLRDVFFFRNVISPDNYYARTDHALPRPAKGKVPRLTPEWKILYQMVAMDSHESCKFRLPIPQRERKKAINVALSEGINLTMKFLVIGPGSKMPAKQWPCEYFEDLGNRILSEYPDLQLIILGGKEDSFMGDSLCDVWGERSHNLAGKLSIYGSAAILEQSEIYIGNDTGTMHLAAMAGVPCLAIFSARDYPGKWYPYGAHNTVLRRSVECEICMLQVCEYNNKCLKNIKSGEVFDVTRNMLRNTLSK
ncbi:MAG: glycosyltransferase family 9 protein [Gammaproteobacteria bacterium]|nr:glycosyltransferase family 9 protein [Gammaproteobacteria bacterium]